jgi:ABC-type branched-subunit amino acid transport system substrate-binding protein
VSRPALVRALAAAPAAVLALAPAGCAPRSGSGSVPGTIHAIPPTRVDPPPASRPPSGSVGGAWLEAHRQPPRFAGPPLAADLVAVLLPLTGAHAALGRAVRTAIELVPGARWSFLDTRGTEDGAAAAIAEAARLGAAMVLGPLGAAEARAAARAAVRAGLPIALLAPDDAPAAPAEGIFRLVPSAEREARQTAALAVELGHEAFAVLAPDDELGAAQSEAFAAAAVRAGARVTRRALYDPTGSDLEPTVRRVLGLIPAENPRLARHLARHGKDGWKTFSPDVDFDALYVPDEYARAALVAAYLPYFNVETRSGGVVDTLALRQKHGGRLPAVVQLFGSSGWQHLALVTAGGAAVEGALVAARCPGAGGETAWSDDAADAIAAYQARAGAAPGPAALQAQDAALLVKRALRHSADRGLGRAGVAAALALGVVDRGVCGTGVVGRDGQLERDLFILRVEGDDLVRHAD